jgi:hypothetical protein
LRDTVAIQISFKSHKVRRHLLAFDPHTVSIALRDGELVGEVKLQGVTWRVTRIAGMFRIWTDATNPRYVISADIPCEILEAMARDVAARDRQQDRPVELGPDVDFVDVDSTAAKSARGLPREQLVKQAIDETDYP